MSRLLFGWWLQIWPNLAANVIWVPVAAIHHLLIKRHITSLHEHGVATPSTTKEDSP